MSPAVARYLGQSCSREGPGACCSFAPIMPLTSNGPNLVRYCSYYIAEEWISKILLGKMPIA